MPELKERLSAAVELLNDVRVLFITGTPSATKDNVVNSIKEYFVKWRKVVTSVYEEPLESYPGMVLILGNSDFIQKRYTEELGTVIASKFRAGGNIVISCESVESFSNKFSESLYKYISSSAAELKVEYPSGSMARI